MKQTSSVHDSAAPSPPFGSRFLTDESAVWSQNAWDHVPPPPDQAHAIALALHHQRLAPVPPHDAHRYNSRPARHWDNFYKMNSSHFFRNRNWLHLEFPELLAATQPEAGPVTIAEIGCGAGNAVFPLLSSNENPALTLRAYDYSSHAIKLVQNNPLYLAPPVGSIHAAVWDLSSPDTLPPGTAPISVDIVVLVFVLSALHPDEWARAIANITTILKPGGRVLLRDYGRHDLTQLRFKAGRLLDDNFYIRGDSTRVYFFDLEELALLFTGSPARDTADTTRIHAPPSPPPLTPDPDPDPDQHPPPTPTIHPHLRAPLPGCPPHPLFATEQLGIDRRLLLNRKRHLKMYRVWMQAQFRKLPLESAE